MRLFYSAILYLLLPAVFARLAWRGLRNRGYWYRWGERLGFFQAPELHEPIWVHAVSVGEALAAAPLIRALLARYPQRSLVITTTTPTGSERVQALFGEKFGEQFIGQPGGRVFHVYFPYDLPAAVNRFLDKTHPGLALVMETELWPNLFRQCARRQIPLLIANARLSARSARGYGKLGGLMRETLADISLIAAQNESDAARFRTLGVRADGITVMGNLKFDQRIPGDLEDRAEALRRELGVSRPVWIAASTHEGEDEQVLDAFARLRESHPDALLLLVPRHPERFARVAALARKRGYAVVLRSEGLPCDAQTAVFVGDTLGELLLFYAVSDVAFVAGSLVPVGGHNMLEPAALGVPVVFGPHLFNFSDISRDLLEAGAARRVENSEQLAAVVGELLGEAALRAEMGEAGRKWVAENRGALERLLGLLARYLS
ncbi:MAG: lipid IV(A) 3-deoxy-D-manno-octulosonic acid transferase [Gammaproteobacteria bacterium]|nr:lipid IV(A) 3-deoxy-D-manno-octulosonic acid transferase [Gammaproteobacteria bacterium]MCF6363163.1 lipid IV(A) 3-deoxy-D-manno-octulosonic acid transferase [Gammaproteobacteria bacterium]